MEKKVLTTNDRVDNYENVGVDVSNSIVKKYTLIDHVVKIGEKDTDFVIESIPELIEEFDIQKQINEAAKSATLEGQIAACLHTGGNPDTDFMINSSMCGDISGLPTDPIEAKKMLSKGTEVLNSIPGSIKQGLSTEEVLALVEDMLNKKLASQNKEEVKNVVNEQVDEGGNVNE